jgi:prepilin-type processing-associated H-X9-DG protein
VELLVVIAIIGILVALLLPAVQAAREAARRMQCANNFKQVALALHSYHDATKRFPVGQFYTIVGQPPSPNMGWSVYILPYLEEQTVYDRFDFSPTVSYASPPNPSKPGLDNLSANKTLIPSFLCPTDPAYGELINTTSESPGPDSCMTNVCAVVDSVKLLIGSSYWEPRPFPEVDGIFGGRRACKLSDIQDGTSKTLAIGEVTAAGQGTNLGHFWSSHNMLDTHEGINGPSTIPGGLIPSSYNLFTTGFASFHSGGATFGYADGSVRFLTDQIARTTLAALTTRNGPSSSNAELYPGLVVSPEPSISGNE